MAKVRRQSNIKRSKGKLYQRVWVEMVPKPAPIHHVAAPSPVHHAAPKRKSPKRGKRKGRK